MAAPSLGLATAVLAFLGFAFSGVEGSSAGGFDLNFQVGRLQVPRWDWVLGLEFGGLGLTSPSRWGVAGPMSPGGVSRLRV